jgi:hypothetical protein
MRVLVYCQAFEDYNIDAKEGEAPYFKFKSGADYECIVPDDTRITNVIAQIFAFVSSGQDDQSSDWREFPTKWEILQDGELTEMEKSYKEHGDTYSWVKLKYENHRIVGRI